MLIFIPKCDTGLFLGMSILKYQKMNFQFYDICHLSYIYVRCFCAIDLQKNAHQFVSSLFLLRSILEELHKPT